MIANSDLMWRSKVFVSLREQSRMLARIAGEAPDGIRRLETAAAYALSGACLGDSQQRLEEGPQMPGGRDRAPDPARRRPCQPFAGRAAQCLSPGHDGDGFAERQQP
ncbi:MAG: hypothetical protein WDN03_14955 [Rhizomicrobium sp.]